MMPVPISVEASRESPAPCMSVGVSVCAAAHAGRRSRARRHTKRILYQKTQTQRALLSLPEAPRQTPHGFIVVRPTTPLGTAFTPRMVRNHGAGLLEDSATRASPEPQVRPLAPCFTARSPGRGTSPDIRPMCLGAPDFRSGSLIDDALESPRAHRAHPSGTATTHFPPNRPQITTLGPTLLPNPGFLCRIGRQGRVR